MDYGVVISSNNYNGQLAIITYYPDTGGTVNLGANVLPHTFDLDYYYGSYELYFSDFGTTCYAYILGPITPTPTTTSTPTPTPTATEPYLLLFEDGSIATAENNNNIEIDKI